MYFEPNIESNFETVKVIISAVGLVIGPIIGAITAVVAIWFKEVFEKKKNVQLWFEQTYIIEGIDRLLWYLKTHEIYYTKLLATNETIKLADGRILPYLKLDLLDELPVDAIIKVENLFGTNLYTAITLNLYDELLFFENLPAEKRSKALISDKLGVIRNACKSLTDIRDELLLVKVKKKSDTNRFQGDEKIQAILENCGKTVQNWLGRSKKRENLIAKDL